MGRGQGPREEGGRDGWMEGGEDGGEGLREGGPEPDGRTDEGGGGIYSPPIYHCFSAGIFLLVSVCSPPRRRGGGIYFPPPIILLLFFWYLLVSVCSRACIYSESGD